MPSTTHIRAPATGASPPRGARPGRGTDHPYTIGETDRAGLSYSPVDISADAEALARVKSLGYAQAPVVMVGADHWSGFRPDKIKAAALAVEAIAI